MAASAAEIELRLRAVEARVGRLAEDGEAHSEVIVDTAARVRKIERGVDAILAHLGLDVPEEPDPELE